MHWFEHRGMLARGVEIRRRRQTQATDERSTEVGKDIPEEVGGYHDIEAFGTQDEIQTGSIDELRVRLDVRVVFGHSAKDLVPEDHAMALGIRLGDRGQMFSGALAGEVEGVADNALGAPARKHRPLDDDLTVAPLIDAAADIRIFPLSILPHDEHIDVARLLALERRLDPLVEDGWPHVDVLIEGTANRQQ